MKFKDKDGKIYQGIKQAKRDFCYARWQQSEGCAMCDECPVSCANNGTDYGCDTFTENTPAEAARLMGYEVIEENSLIKPLKDWTLGELQEWCYQYRHTHDAPCEELCDIYKRGICLKEWVHDWDLEPEPRFTPEEVERASAILTLFTEADELEKTDTGHVRVGRNECIVSMLFNDLFPSILPGQTVKLSDILGDPTQTTERR